MFRRQKAPKMYLHRFKFPRSAAEKYLSQIGNFKGRLVVSFCRISLSCPSLTFINRFLFILVASFPPPIHFSIVPANMRLSTYFISNQRSLMINSIYLFLFSLFFLSLSLSPGQKRDFWCGHGEKTCAIFQWSGSVSSLCGQTSHWSHCFRGRTGSSRLKFYAILFCDSKGQIKYPGREI